jgi:UDP-glucuronate 4-epimerase
MAEHAGAKTGLKFYQAGNMTVLVTGAAGFIGSHVSHALLARGAQVIGVDNLNDYYQVQLKRDRLTPLLKNPAFQFF